VTALAAEFTSPSIAYSALSPVLIVTIAAVVGVLVDAFAPRAMRWSAQVAIAAAGLAASFVAVCVVAERREITAAGALVVDGPTLFLQGTITLLAIGQRDMKRLVAYSSVSHFGFIALGVFAFTSQGGSGATLYMVNHAFSTGALFLLVGFLATRRGSRLIDDFGGASKVAPWLGAAFLVAGLSALSLPGLSTVVSEFLVLAGTFTVHRWYAVLATLGIVLAAVYVLWMVQRTIHGPVKEGMEHFRDLDLREAWVIAPVMAIIVVLGLYPKPLLDVITPSVKSSYTEVRPSDPNPSVPSIAGLHGPGGVQ
jgi:formate hydrogenlyase subunit 3/multisubunit Na+/H+ antiporter MnhD subunit